MKGTNKQAHTLTMLAVLLRVPLNALAVFTAAQFVCIADAESISNETSVVHIPIAALDTGKGNFFDSQSFDPSVLVNPEDSSQLIMFFSAMAAPAARGEMRIGRATANVSDPTVWTVSNGGKPMLEADGKSWDQEGSGMRCDSVLYNPPREEAVSVLQSRHAHWPGNLIRPGPDVDQAPQAGSLAIER
jgi:hypothetical protein